MLRTEVTLWDRLARVAAERCRGGGAAIIVSWGNEPRLFGRFDPGDRISVLNGIIIVRGKRHDVMIPGHRATLLVVDPTRNLLDDLDDVAQWISDELASTGVRDFDLRERALQSTSEGIVVADALAPDLPVIYANRAFEQLSGYSAAEVLGRNCRFLQGEGTDRTQLDVLRAALREQRPCRVELLNHRKDGRPFWNELSIAPVRDGSGIVTHFVGVQKDITDQKYTERALRESEARYAALFDNTAIGIYRSMPETGRIFMANRASATMLGYDSPEELVAANAILERPHPTYPREHFQRVMERDGAIANLQAPWLKKDGSLVFIRESCRSVVDHEGTLLYYEGTIEEVGAPHVSTEERPASLISAAASGSDAVMAIDNSGRIVTFNREFVDLWKIPPELLHGRQDELIMSFMLDQLVEPIEFLFDDDRGVPVRRFAMRDARVMERVSQRQFVHQEEAGWVWSFRDVTQASEAERQLRRSALERRAVMDTVPDIIFTLDPAGNVVDWNREFEEVLLGAGELPHGSVLELFPPDSRPAIVQLFDWAFDNETARVDCIIERDGQSMIYEWLAALLPGESGEMAGLICTGRDITERKRAAEALADAAATWRRTFDAINFPVLVVSRDGAIRRANDAARALFAVSFDALIASNLGDYAAEPWAMAMRLIDKALLSGTTATAQARNEGLTWDLAVSAFSPEAGSPAMIVARDITRLTELQESLRRSEVLAAMGSLVGGVAHEVRNPLFGISATLDAFEAEFGGSAIIAEYLATFRHDVSRMKRLMNELLEYGKPYMLDLREHAPRDILGEGMRVVAAVASRKNIGIDVRIDDELPTIVADRDRLVQVLKNILENALDFSPLAGRVSITVTETIANARRWVSFIVRDQGPGFAEKDIPRLFEPFFTRRGGGTGLGLALVQRIVEEHGGAVIASNAEGGGALVEIRLPEPD
jgi:PAS domain S-box-containing protein